MYFGVNPSRQWENTDTRHSRVNEETHKILQYIISLLRSIATNELYSKDDILLVC